MIARTFQRVVIGSGDHIFAEQIAPLAALGVHTVVASWNRSLSKALRIAALEVRLLDTAHTPSPQAALADPAVA